MPLCDLLTLLPYFFMFFLGGFKFLHLCLLWSCRFYLLLLTFFLSAVCRADTNTHTTVCTFDLFFVPITFSKKDRCGWIIFSEYFTYRILTPSQEAFTNVSWLVINEFCSLLVTSWWSPSLCCQIHSTKSSKSVPGLWQRYFPQMTYASAMPLRVVQHWSCARSLLCIMTVWVTHHTMNNNVS